MYIRDYAVLLKFTSKTRWLGDQRLLVTTLLLYLFNVNSGIILSLFKQFQTYESYFFPGSSKLKFSSMLLLRYLDPGKGHKKNWQGFQWKQRSSQENLGTVPLKTGKGPNEMLWKYWKYNWINKQITFLCNLTEMSRNKSEENLPEQRFTFCFSLSKHTSICIFVLCCL